MARPEEAYANTPISKSIKKDYRKTIVYRLFNKKNNDIWTYSTYLKLLREAAKKHFFFSGATRRSLCQYSYFEINKKRLKKNNSLETILQKNNDISNLYIYIYMGNYFLDFRFNPCSHSIRLVRPTTIYSFNYDSIDGAPVFLTSLLLSYYYSD